MQRSPLRFLPPNTDPEGTVCIQFEIPNDPEWIRDFCSQLVPLSQWMLWQRDADHKGTLVARRWKAALDTFMKVECGMVVTDVRVEDCLIQVQYTGSDEWITVGDIGDCSTVVDAAAAAAAAQISADAAQAQADLALALAKSINQPGAVPGGDVPITTGECRDIQAVVFGNQAYIVPFRVLPGDTVQVVAYQGAWSYENSYSALWYGWNGGLFLLGTVNLYEDTSTATGVYSTRHVQTLIGRYGTDFLDLSNGLQTTPGPTINVPGSTEYPLILQMNDTDLTDNQGSILLQIRVCSGEWCFVIDFADGDFMFVTGGYQTFGPDGAGRDMGVYNNPTWDTTDLLRTGAIYERAVSISLAFASTPLTYIKMKYDYTQGGTHFGAHIFDPAGVDLASSETQGTDLELIWTGEQTMDKFGFMVWPYGSSTIAPNGSGKIKRLEMHGRGTNPFGTDNCP